MRGLGQGLLPTPVGRHHPAFKTRMCVHWQAGRCRHGEECTYAHGSSELRSYGLPPPDVRPSQSLHCALTGSTADKARRRVVSDILVNKYRSRTALRRSKRFNGNRVTAMGG